MTSNPAAMAFLESVLSESLRKDSVQAAINNKVRGKRLLLERIIMKPPPGERAKRRGKEAVGEATSGSSSSSEKRPARPAKRKERRKLLLDAARQVTYEQLQMQNAAWNQFYQQQAIANDQQAQQMDWHGARVRVVQSASATHSGLEGLVLTETERMLLVVTSNEKRGWVPKSGTTIGLVLADGRVLQCDASARLSEQAPPPNKAPPARQR